MRESQYSRISRAICSPYRTLDKNSYPAFDMSMDEPGHFTFQAWINPLGFSGLDYPFAPGYIMVGQEPPPLEEFLEFLCDVDLPSDAVNLTARYHEIHPAAQPLFAPPAQRAILGKLIWPLRHAQASYVLGNYLGTISLCGFVAEMLAILLYDLEQLDAPAHPSDTRDEMALSSVVFEKLDQSRREKILRARGLIPKGCDGHFANIREHRRKYLHYFSHSHDGIVVDARKAFRLTAELTAGVIGQTVQDGAVRLRPALLRYLAQHDQLAAVP